MFYTLYKITNKINGKIYIGTHKTNNLEDGYFGSGKHLKRSINKYGIENFTKEIMYLCRSAEEMFDMEALLVDEGFVKRKDTYNIREGGFGGFDHMDRSSENHPMYGKHLSDEHKRKLSIKMRGNNNPFYGRVHSEETKNKISKANSGENSPLFGRYVSDEERKEMSIRVSGENNPMYGKPGAFTGKSHTEENKQKISKAVSIAQMGEKNHMYGKCWVYCPYTHENKPVPRNEIDDWIDRGWIKGTKNNSNNS